MLLLLEDPFVEPLAVLARGLLLLGRELERGAPVWAADAPATSLLEEVGFVRSPLNGNGFESSFS